MSTAEELLQGAAKDGSLLLSEWPRVLPFLLERLETNVYKLFPIPQTPPQVIRAGSGDQTLTLPTLPSQQDSAAPRDAVLPSSPPAANRPGASTLGTPNAENSSAPAVADSNEPQSASKPVLPRQILESYNYVRSTLSNSFSKNPPHTIQRLAELVLYPRQHYRFLSRYLNALDRTVSVSSGPAIFPTASSAANGLSNGITVSPTSLPHHQIDDTEALGGALLTPIPWLRDRSGSSPAAADRSSKSPTSPSSPSSTGAVTQGELLRQEQKASDPPAPVASLPSRILALNRANEATTHGQDEGSFGNSIGRQIPLGDAGIALEDDPADEEPHALGPEAITPEDMGPQAKDPEKIKGHMLDLEAAVGRPGEGRRPSKSPEVRSAEEKKEEQDEAETEAKADEESEKKEAEDEDSEGDVEMDVDQGKTDAKNGTAAVDADAEATTDATGQAGD